MIIFVLERITAELIIISDLAFGSLKFIATKKNYGC